MIHKVFKALNEDSRKGDFIDLTNKDKLDLNIDLTNIEIESISKWSWKKYLKDKVKSAAFTYLVEENLQKEKTKEITFTEFKMSAYLRENKSTSVSKVIFNTRARTLDIKEYNP